MEFDRKELQRFQRHMPAITYPLYLHQLYIEAFAKTPILLQKSLRVFETRFIYSNMITFLKKSTQGRVTHFRIVKGDFHGAIENILGAIHVICACEKTSILSK